jgi:hypothetical protein
MKKIWIAALLSLSACSTMGGASGGTGRIDFGKGYVCSGTVGATDPATCTKGLTWGCEVPLPKNSAGECNLASISAEVPFAPQTGWKCAASATASITPCTKIVTIACMVPVPKDQSGICP